MTRLLVTVFVAQSLTSLALAQSGPTQPDNCPYVATQSGYAAVSQPSSGGPGGNLAKCQNIAAIEACYLQTPSGPNQRMETVFFTGLDTGTYSSDSAQMQLFCMISPTDPNCPQTMSTPVGTSSTKPSYFEAVWSRPDQDQAALTALNNCILKDTSIITSSGNSANTSPDILQNPSGGSATSQNPCTCQSPYQAYDPSGSNSSGGGSDYIYRENYNQLANTSQSKSISSGGEATDSGAPCKVVQEVLSSASCKQAHQDASQGQASCGNQDTTTAQGTVTQGSATTTVGCANTLPTPPGSPMSAPPPATAGGN